MTIQFTTKYSRT